ncbi:MAG: YggU family protein [Kiritimatiellae bacterium]|nr:YggU family protein [Kiritimatiellia bacterium]MCO5068495.1 DUF167 domain-containing protein [Kiritimatiellia bacterium]
MSWWNEKNGAVHLHIRVAPRASRTEVAGTHGEALKIRLQAPPVDGAANEALIEFLAEALQVPRSTIRIERGHTGRNKEISIQGSAAQIQPARLLR